MKGLDTLTCLGIVDANGELAVLLGDTVRTRIGAEVPVVAVSPIIAGAAVKGPAAKMMREFGLAPTPVTVAAHYRHLVTGLVMDRADASFSNLVEAQGMAVCLTDALMRDEADRRRLAQQCLDFARSLA